MGMAALLRGNSAEVDLGRCSRGLVWGSPLLLLSECRLPSTLCPCLLPGCPVDSRYSWKAHWPRPFSSRLRLRSSLGGSGVGRRGRRGEACVDRPGMGSPGGVPPGTGPGLLSEPLRVLCRYW